MPADQLEHVLREQLDRVREHVDDAELAGLLKSLADRYEVARERTETGEAMIRVKLHRGKHNEYRWLGDDRVMPLRRT